MAPPQRLNCLPGVSEISIFLISRNFSIDHITKKDTKTRIIKNSNKSIYFSLLFSLHSIDRIKYPSFAAPGRLIIRTAITLLTKIDFAIILGIKNIMKRSKHFFVFQLSEKFTCIRNISI